MKLSEFKSHLSKLTSILFVKQNRHVIPHHFHITEVGVVTKKFIDCGGSVHENKFINLQLWVADDYNHRLSPASLLNIIDMSQKIIGGEDLEIEVEYQNETIGRYDVAIQGQYFVLNPKHTDCLAPIKCNIPQSKNSCVTGSKCC